MILNLKCDQIGTMASNFKCDFCGVLGFLDYTALRTHQGRNGLCLAKQRAVQRAQQEQTAHVMEAEHEGFGSVNDWNTYVQANVETSEEMSPEEFIDRSDNKFSSPARCDREFDGTFQLVFFMRQCHNGGGLSHKNMNQLLRLLHHPQFDSKKVQVHTAAEVCRYKERLTSESGDTRWEKVEVHEEAGHASVQLLHRNPLRVLEDLFSSPKNKEEFALHSSIATEGSERLYTTLQSAEWWREMDQEIESTCRGGVIAPIILYSDQTALSHNKRTQGWPLVMTLGNINCNLRSLPEGHALLAILPVVGPNDPGEFYNTIISSYDLNFS